MGSSPRLRQRRAENFRLPAFSSSGSIARRTVASAAGPRIDVEPAHARQKAFRGGIGRRFRMSARQQKSSRRCSKFSRRLPVFANLECPGKRSQVLLVVPAGRAMLAGLADKAVGDDARDRWHLARRRLGQLPSTSIGHFRCEYADRCRFQMPGSPVSTSGAAASIQPQLSGRAAGKAWRQSSRIFGLPPSPAKCSEDELKDGRLPVMMSQRVGRWTGLHHGRFSGALAQVDFAR